MQRVGIIGELPALPQRRSEVRRHPRPPSHQPDPLCLNGQVEKCSAGFGFGSATPKLRRFASLPGSVGQGRFFKACRDSNTSDALRSISVTPPIRRASPRCCSLANRSIKRLHCQSDASCEAGQLTSIRASFTTPCIVIDNAILQHYCCNYVAKLRINRRGALARSPSRCSSGDACRGRATLRIQRQAATAVSVTEGRFGQPGSSRVQLPQSGWQFRHRQARPRRPVVPTRSAPRPPAVEPRKPIDPTPINRHSEPHKDLGGVDG